MLDGSPAGDLHGDGEQDGAPPAGGDDQKPKTVEEAEAIWRNRVSGKDRAHNAEVATLRGQITALESQIKAKPTTGSEDDPREGEVQRLRQELEAEKAARVMDSRKAKYPFAADTLDDDTLARMDEAKLAALNARLDDTDVPAPGYRPSLDPNRAARRPSSPTSPEEKSVDDLKSDLRRYAPEFQASLE